MTVEDLFDIYIQDAEHPFSGWDFSHIRTRFVTEPLTWSYHSLLLPFVRSSDTLLDMGTGGGEFLVLLAPLPRTTHATEAYEPNLPIARRRLEPLGVRVDKVRDDRLPYRDDYFDLIINRHESYSPSEVYRTLKPGGFFVTQQVGGSNNLELNELLGASIDDSVLEYLHWNLDYASKELSDVGIKVVEEKEAFPRSRFFDIGAVVYYLKAIPWQVPDFSIEEYRSELAGIHEKLIKEDYIDVTSHYFLIISQK